MFDKPSLLNINNIPPPKDFFDATEFNAQALEVVKTNLVFPETVAILSQKVKCFLGGNTENSQDEGTSFEEFEKLAILDAISRTLAGNNELAQQLDTIYFFDVSYNQSIVSNSSAVFGIRKKSGEPSIAVCKEYAYGVAPENMSHIIQYLAHISAHETKHFIQWSEGRLDVATMMEIHQFDQKILDSHADRVSTPALINSLNQQHVSPDTGHPLEVEAQNTANEIYAQMTYLHPTLS